MKKHPVIEKIEKKWKLRIIAKVVIWFIVLVGFSICLMWLLSLSVLFTFLFGLIAVIIFFWEWKKIPKQNDVVQLINTQFHSSEYSTELIFDEQTNGISTIQRERVLNALNQTIPRLVYPVKWRMLTISSSLLFLIVVGVWTGLKLRSNDFINTSQVPDSTLSALVKSDTVFFNDAYVKVAPPTYSGLRQTKSELNIETLEQSTLTWELQFQGEPSHVWLQMSQGDSLPLSKKGRFWEVTNQPKESGFYTIKYTWKEEVVTSPFYQLILNIDQAPQAKIASIPQHQRLEYKRGLSVDFSISLSDDYGLTDGYVVATIAKGSGESVMFREQKIPLPIRVKGKKIIVPMSLKPDDFGMEPGNELYFYVTAFDNKQPTIQRSRTETFFFILKDTAQVEFSLEGSLGVDLMPDFFRSQLQIILDTEKLLKDKPQLDKKNFNQTSNALGFDQKQLRLKYGQFIGEEDESGLDVETEEPEEMGEVEADGSNVLEEFGHDHDHENEAGQLMDKGTEPADEEQSKNPLQAYIHDHGDEETATFHTQSLKTKLRAALTEMWDAELYLRLFQPEKSLPYQYRAQELLKEIKNHARIYVQRIGFDPPTVNEAESRLTGEMKELNDDHFTENQDREILYPAIRKCIATIDQLIITNDWIEQTKGDLEDAGNELAGLAIDRPGEYLAALNVIRLLIDKSSFEDEDVKMLNNLKATLESVIEEVNPLPAPQNWSMDEMNTHFLNNLLKTE